MSLTFISAGAGSGKTYTLTETLGKLLDQNGIRPAGVIATTFTNKAASELRERVRQCLLGKGEFALASAMGQARIGTINSVCGSLLERFAFEAGLPTQQRVIDETQSPLLIREAIDAVMSGQEVTALSRLAARLSMDWTADIKTLLALARSNDIDPQELGRHAQQNADELLAHFPKPSGLDLNLRIRHAIEDALPALRAAAEAKGVKKTSKTIEALERFQRALEKGQTTWVQWIKLSKEADPEKGLQPLVEPIIQAAQAVASHPQLQADIRSYLDHIFAVCGKALAHYRQRKLELGVVDFTDQEYLLLKLLDHPDVTATLKDELDLLLVDEFQDTNPIQLALFLKLSEFAKQTYWVGDIKQAIYAFRGSDTELMQAVLKSLPALGGAKQVLDSSWRSRPPLVRLVNEIFAAAFADTSHDEVGLTAQRPETLSLPAFANWVLGGKKASQADVALAHGVRQLLASGTLVQDPANQQSRPVQARDIAILCHSNDGIAKVAGHLRKLGIQVGTSRPGLLATPEARLAHACLRRLNDPRDTIATAEIIALADSVEPESWLADRLAYLAAGQAHGRWRETGDQAHPLLASISTLRKELPLITPREALQRVITEGHLSQLVLAWQQDPAVARMRLANLQAMLDMATQYETAVSGVHQAPAVSGLLLWFDEQAASGKDVQAEPAIDAVRVLTYHASKGLEWPVVILTDLDKDIQDRLWDISAVSAAGVDALSPLQGRFIRYWPWPFGGQVSKIAIREEISSSATAARFRSMAQEEAKRLLYVGMTRARDMLVLARNENQGLSRLDMLGANWLNTDNTQAGLLTLPSGEAIAAQHWRLEPPSPEDPPATVAPRTLHWFNRTQAVARQSLYSSPSGTVCGVARIAETQAIGQRISVARGPDWSDLGTAVHGCLAASFTDAGTPINEVHIHRLLAAHQVDAYLDASDLLGQIQAFHGWIASRWPGCRPLAEVPLLTSLPNGQILNGRIDLLLETHDGFVLIDHKSSPVGSDQHGKLALEYGGQLDAYARNTTAVTGRPVLEQWLFLPVAGVGLRIESR
jgi:ATP-dependent exoDNAse (exonuclease V) beta subunit